MRPAAMAAAACSTSMTNEEPPTDVLSVYRRLDAEVFGELEGGRPAGGARAEDAVDLGEGDAGVLEGVAGGLGVELEDGLVGDDADLVGLVCADDRDLLEEGGFFFSVGRHLTDESVNGFAERINECDESGHDVAIGLNLGREISSVMSSKTTSTGMSQRIWEGSGSIPTRLV